MPCKHLIMIDYSHFQDYYKNNQVFKIDPMIKDAVIDSFLEELPKRKSIDAMSCYPTNNDKQKSDASDSDADIDTDEICDDHTATFSEESSSSEAESRCIADQIDSDIDNIGELVHFNEQHPVMESSRAAELDASEVAAAEIDASKVDSFSVGFIDASSAQNISVGAVSAGAENEKSSDEMVVTEDTHIFERGPEEDADIILVLDQAQAQAQA